VIRAEFVVPPLFCGELNGGITEEVELGDSIEVGINEACTGGSATYVAFGETDFQMTISPGDKVMLRASVSPTGAKHLKSTVEDLSTGVSQTQSLEAVPENDTTAYVGVTWDAGQPQSLANFGTVEWVKVQLNGQALGSFDPFGTSMWRSKPPRTLVETTPLTPSGGSFRSIWRHGS
jgi:Peptidase A4 family